jgi:pyruvate-formate lyase-activating enzyme
LFCLLLGWGYFRNANKGERNMQLMLVITNQCNKACAHCGLSASIENKRGLSLRDMYHYIDDISTMFHGAGTSGVLEIRFTGGEPFLRFDDLLETIRHAKARGATLIGCTTNASWATSLPEACRKMDTLQRAGLRDIRISFDEFHGSLDQPETIRNAFIAALEANVSVGLKVVVYPGSVRASDILHILEDVIRDAIFFIEELSLLPVGRARKLPAHMFLREKGLPAGACNLVGKFVVGVDKNVYPCCVPGWPRLLHLGNTRSESLSDIINKAYKNPLLKIFHHKGPIYLVPYLEKAGLVFPPGTYVNRCHLCQEVLKAADSSNAARKCLTEAVDVWENEQIRINSVLEIVDQFLASSQ